MPHAGSVLRSGISLALVSSSSSIDFLLSRVAVVSLSDSSNLVGNLLVTGLTSSNLLVDALRLSVLLNLGSESDSNETSGNERLHDDYK